MYIIKRNTNNKAKIVPIFYYLFAGLIISFAISFLISCASKPDTSINSGSDQLDIAIRASSDYLNQRLNKGIKLVFLNFQSECPSLSEYIIDGLIENTVNDGLFTAVDRQNLALIQQEMNFQLSGEVSDESAQAIGKLLGAQVIVSGAISHLGTSYRLRVRAISVETAEIQGQYSQDIVTSPRILALIQNCGGTSAQINNPSLHPGSQNQAPSGPSNTASVPSVTPSGNSTALPYERYTVLRQLDVVNTGTFGLSPDGKYALVDTNAGRRLCDTQTGRVIRNIDIPSFSVIAFSPDGKRTVSASGSRMRILDIDSGAQREISGHTGTIRYLHYSPDGRFFLSASTDEAGSIGGKGIDNSVKVWNAETGQEVMTLSHSGGVGTAVFSSDGRLIVSRDNNTVYIWDARNGNRIRTISIPNVSGFPRLLALSPDGSKIAVASTSRITIYDSNNGRELSTLTGHSGNVVDMCFCPEGNRLISMSSGQTKNLYIWNMETGWGTDNHLSIGGPGYSSLRLSADGTVLLINNSGRRTFVLGMEKKK